MDINKHIIEKLVTEPPGNDCGWFIYELNINKANITSNINESRRYVYLCQHEESLYKKRKAIIFRSKNEESNIISKALCSHI